MDIYNKTTYSKRYVQFTLNKPLHSLTNISFSLARGYVPLLRGKCKRKTFSKTDKQILKQKYIKLLIRDSILKAKGIFKTTKNEEILPFNATYNSNNVDVFPTIT